MKIVIVGAGGIGLLIGSYLGRGEHDVVFVDKNDKVVSAINQSGIGVMKPGGSRQDDFEFFPATATVDALSIEECGLVILAVKSFDTEAAVQAVTHLITKETPVVTLQTGLGNLEKIEKVERRKNIVGGFTYMAAAALGPGRVRPGGIGKTYLGELDGRKTARCLSIGELFNNCQLETDLVDDIVERIWCKVIVYSAINSLSGILKIKNGQLLEKMESITLAKKLIDEAANIAEKCGINLAHYDLYELFFSACRQTADNISTMLLDIINGRRTEIDALCGEICRLAQEQGTLASTHQTMTELIKLGEKWGVGFQQNA